MEADLRNLIDDPRFRAYHRELVKPREFNTFDVLRYSGCEIRHSNVLAWLIRPADTHGIRRTGPRHAPRAMIPHLLAGVFIGALFVLLRTVLGAWYTGKAVRKQREDGER